MREFDLTQSDLVGSDEGGKSSWLCFQSFALSVRGGRRAEEALRKSIEEHIVRLAAGSRPPRAIAEIGTKAGLREARYFGMSFSGLSADKRPLFELDLATIEWWRQRFGMQPSH